MLPQVAGEQLEEDDESMFNLDGFETEEEQSREAGFEERGNGYQVATDMAFPQSDDEEISTDGEWAECDGEGCVRWGS